MTWGEGDAKQRVTAEMLRGLGYGPPHSEGTAGLRGGGQQQSREGEGQTEARRGQGRARPPGVWVPRPVWAGSCRRPS